MHIRIIKKNLQKAENLHVKDILNKQAKLDCVPFLEKQAKIS